MKVISMSAAMLLSLAATAQQPVYTRAALESVTVYRVGAEMNHKTKITLPKGSSQVVVQQVANAIDENSIQVSASNKVTVMSAGFARNFLKEEDLKSPAYLKLEDSLQAARRELTRTRNNRVAEENTLVLLDKNQALGSGPNGGASVTELMKLAEYYKMQQVELRNSIAVLQEKETKQQEGIQKLEKQLKELSNDPNASGGQLVLQVMSENGGPADLEVSYITPAARWGVYYDLKATNTSSPLQLFYKANVVQNTGVDWKKVKLTLSTGNPSQNGTAPVLSAWFLSYMEIIRPGMIAGSAAYQNRLQSMEMKSMAPAPPPVAMDSMASGVDLYTHQNENQLSATFDIDIPYDVASNGKYHSVTLKEFSLPATYKYYAVPKADPDAFLMAEIMDYEKLSLLPGEANIIFEGMYVGKSFIDPGATTDTLNLSVGRDKKVIVKREKITDMSGVKFLGNQKRQTFTYEIRVRNAKKEAVNMLLKDQYPVTTDKSMEVELLESDGAAVNAETGVLTWKLDLAPGETKKVRLSYSVKYPKDKLIANL
ncbi:DUF4139 domain-containing protein [Chitinophaga sp. GCM10012297]|uniref:DUF4139 domain-containing protein n=1 Tax=Chitinophaga chungangae TaxID=2821488 RepID=A0ABS3YBG5_9BACT|nr:DUF4139 domain-containing protein [Chitinophaga chungangae]MBO9152009.1 DUF4139 domain-containing protein [Chitinophaga chungangae]